VTEESSSQPHGDKPKQPSTTLRDLQRNWQELGEHDPLWAILTQDDKKGGGWDIDDFFATGVREIDELLAYIKSLGLPLRRKRALDFGCGVGRLTQPLAARFEEAHGVDIAPAMIELAEKHNSHGHRCLYHLNEADNLHIFPEDHFDLIYSNITLQHMPPPLAKRYLDEFIRVLARGGVLVFQLPSEPVRTLRGETLARRLKNAVKSILPQKWRHQIRRGAARLQDKGIMNMYATPRADVEAFLKDRRVHLIDATEDHSAGDAWRGYRYCVTKP
jgi:ubiquinone/menaquinone biosynthesis C-methylase UbiE